MRINPRTNWQRILLGSACGLALAFSSAQAQEPALPAGQGTQTTDAPQVESPKPLDPEHSEPQKAAPAKDSKPEKTATKESLFPPLDEPFAPHGQGAGDPQQRIRELFGEVETHLRDVDRLLSDASAGDTSRLSEANEAGIGKLLQDSLDRGREAQAKIAEIMQLAQQAGSKQAGGGKSEESGEGDPSQSGKGSGKGSPLDRGQQGQSQEQTPEMGGEKPQGQEEGDKPGGEKPGEKPGDQPDGEEPGGTQPKSPGEGDGAGENRQGPEQGADAADRARQAAQARDGWGDLPSHVKDTFRSQGRSELPVRYRDWIDEYYRKLNRQGDR